MEGSKNQKSGNKNNGCLLVLAILFVIGYFIKDDKSDAKNEDSSIKKNWECECYGDGKQKVMGSHYSTRIYYNLTRKEAEEKCSSTEGDATMWGVHCSILEKK